MTDEIVLSHDVDKKNLISDKITFDPVDAGKVTNKSIFVFNNVDFPVQVRIGVESDRVKLEQKDFFIPIGSFKQITFIVSSKITDMKPVTAKLNIKTRYVVT